MAKRVKITAQSFDDLFVDAMGGDSVAMDEYRDMARKLAKQVNQQLLEMERKGVDSEARRLASAFLGDKKRFRENISNMSFDDVQKQVDQLLTVKGQGDYSIPYALKTQGQIAKIVNSNLFTMAGIDVMDAHITYQANEFLKTDAFKEYAKVYDGTTIIRAAQDHFKRGGFASDLVQAFNRYSEAQDKSTDMAKTWKEATGTLL